jgi:hypothetical protein
MKIHTNNRGIQGLLCSSGTFIPLGSLCISLNVLDLSVNAEKWYDGLAVESLPLQDRLELYDYVICRWLAAKEACLREKWDTVSQHC